MVGLLSLASRAGPHHRAPAPSIVPFPVIATSWRFFPLMNAMNEAAEKGTNECYTKHYVRGDYAKAVADACGRPAERAGGVSVRVPGGRGTKVVVGGSVAVISGVADVSMVVARASGVVLASIAAWESGALGANQLPSREPINGRAMTKRVISAAAATRSRR